MTLFANSLSHTILLGIAGAYWVTTWMWGAHFYDLSTLLLGALASALLTALCTDGLVRFFKLQEDASIGLVFTFFFALGISFVTFYTKNLHLGIEAVMGNVDALQIEDLQSTSLLALVNLICILFFYRPFELMSFDPQFAKILKMRYGIFHFLLLFLTALTCVSAFRAVGVILVIAFLVGPYLTARLFCHRLPQLLFWSPAIGISASLIGVALSRHTLSIWGLPLSTGGIVVVLLGCIYAFALVIHHRKSKVASSKS
jgi:manganese/zinc/iron transport system permease protein